MELPAYNLKAASADSCEYYNCLEETTTQFLEKSVQFVYPSVFHFRNYLQDSGCLPGITSEELILQFLSLGVYSRVYQQKAQKSSWFCILMAGYLKQLRKLPWPGQERIDSWRGKFLTCMHTSRALPDQSICLRPECLEKMIAWLEATGEFDRECEHLSKWAEFLGLQTYENQRTIMRKAISLAEYFESFTKLKLGRYTSGLELFLRNQQFQYKGREDCIFTGRKEVEYHLNMVGAEILNRCMREDFLRAKKKIILVPACLRASIGCQAEESDGALFCRGCSQDCQVFKLARNVNAHHATVVLFRHGSGIPAWLDKFENRKDAGVIGLSCVLNLLEGGYLLRKMGFPAQCVFLDTTGRCHHWNQQEIESGVNLQQLTQILSRDDSRATEPKYSETERSVHAVPSI